MGCDTGFGHRLAVRLNELGFRVYATVISESSAGAIELPKEVRFPDKLHVLAMDVTSNEQVHKVRDHIEQHLADHGEGDCLWAIVNNAGVINAGPIEWGADDVYKPVFEVNTYGVIRVTRVFLPLIRASKGRIVNVASMCGRMSPTNIGYYCMSKHAVVSFSDTLRRELRRFRVRVSTIEPTYFLTEMTDIQTNVDILCRTWANTREDIQQVYGESYLAKLKQVVLKTFDIWHSTRTKDVVVNDMIDAIHNAEPR
ncbi:unnamed protein product, partial [Medioppia subpectinata]